jgi:hypothetical protein
VGIWIAPLVPHHSSKSFFWQCHLQVPQSFLLLSAYRGDTWRLLYLMQGHLRRMENAGAAVNLVPRTSSNEYALSLVLPTTMSPKGLWVLEISHWCESCKEGCSEITWHVHRYEVHSIVTYWSLCISIFRYCNSLHILYHGSSI